jgi:hypothetical protein
VGLEQRETRKTVSRELFLLWCAVEVARRGEPVTRRRLLEEWTKHGHALDTKRVFEQALEISIGHGDLDHGGWVLDGARWSTIKIPAGAWTDGVHAVASRMPEKCPLRGNVVGTPGFTCELHPKAEARCDLAELQGLLA